MMTEPENPFIKSFSDPDAVSHYPEGLPRLTTGFDALPLPRRDAYQGVIVKGNEHA
jgi:hypothetical protein